MNSKVIAGLLISAATLAIQPASAADIPVKAAPPVVVVSAPGWFGYIEGRYLLDPVYGVYHHDQVGNTGRTFLDEGWGAAGRLGYRFNATWDVAVAASYGDYRPGSPNRFGIQRTDGKLTTVDGQIGYNLGGGGQTGRFYVGVRYVEWKHNLVDPPTFTGFRWEGRTQGIGAVGGMDFTATLAGPLSAIGGFEGSVLAGTIRDQITDDPPGGINVFGGSRDRHQVIYQFGGYLGAAYRFAPGWNLAAGYRVSQWVNLQSLAPLLTNGGVVVAPGNGFANHLDHGPFARLTFDLGAR